MRVVLTPEAFERVLWREPSEGEGHATKEARTCETLSMLGK